MSQVRILNVGPGGCRVNHGNLSRIHYANEGWLFCSHDSSKIVLFSRNNVSHTYELHK